MQRYEYAAWFENSYATPDDQDREWVACFIVVAPSAEKAKEWGDHLSISFAARRAPEERFLWSEANLESPKGSAEQAAVPPGYEQPIVPYGYEATDEEIGW